MFACMPLSLSMKKATLKSRQSINRSTEMFYYSWLENSCTFGLDTSEAILNLPSAMNTLKLNRLINGQKHSAKIKRKNADCRGQKHTVKIKDDKLLIQSSSNMQNTNYVAQRTVAEMKESRLASKPKHKICPH